MRCVLFAVLLGMVATQLQAQALKEGELVPIGQDVSLPGLTEGGGRHLVFRYEAKTNASFMRIKFSQIGGSGETAFMIIISGRGGKELAAIEGTRFLKSSSFWTDVLPTDVLRVEVDGRATALNFRIDQIVVQSNAAVPFDVKDPDQREKIETYRSHPQIWKASRAVAKISFVKDGVSDACTGFMIDADHLMTNFHCVNDAESCASAKAIFGFEELDGVVHRDQQVDCEKVELVDQSLDLSVLKLAGSPGRRWGFLELTRRKPIKDEQAYLIHHSYGDPKQITRLDCSVKVPAAAGPAGDTDIGHECDCVRGASGSPLLGEDYKVVGLHHLGFTFDPRWSDMNRAVQMEKIMDRLGR